MKRYLSFLLLAALLFVACTKTIAGSSEAAVTSGGASVTAEPIAQSTASAASTEPVSTEALTDPTDASKEATGTFSVTLNDEPLTPNGAVYTITAAGDYTLTGALPDGQIVVDAGDDDEIKLILSDASIACSTGAPILVKNAGKVTVKAEKNTYNTVTDLRTGSADSLSDSEENYDAAIWADCDLNLSGTGTLIVTANFDNGVKTKDDLNVKNLTLKVTAYGNALKGNDSVEIKSGDLLLVSTASDGVKTENSDVSSKGNHRGTVTISGGHVDIYAACDAISAAYNVEISEEEECVVNLYTASYSEQSDASQTEKYLIVPTSLYSDGSRYFAYLYNDSDADGVWAECTYDTMVYSGRRASYYGLKFRVPDGFTNILFEITDGSTPDGSNYTASTGGDTLNTSMNAYLIDSISGGVIGGDWVQLSSGSNGSNKTTFSSKGIKAENEILIDGGAITIRSMDDGVHANAGTALEDGTVGVGNITVNGGSLTITAADDGMHADNALTLNGGIVTVVQSHEGLEANVLTQNGSTVSVYANDDGLNACKGSATPTVIINGGYTEVTTSSGDTDAIDANGNFLMTGGTVLVRGGSSQGGMSGSVDVDGTVTVTGGTIVALGGICQIPSGDSVNAYVSSGTSFSAGSYTLADAQGNTIFSFTLNGSYSSCWIASDAFKLNGSYVLTQDGTAVLEWTQSSSTEGSYQGFGNFGGFGGHGSHGRR